MHANPIDRIPGKSALLSISHPCGRNCMQCKKFNMPTSLAGQRFGIKEGDDAIWRVSFMDNDLGDLNLEQKTLHPPKARLGTTCCARLGHPCDRNTSSLRSSECTQGPLADRVGFEPTVNLRPRRFSRPLPSATRPPVRLVCARFFKRAGLGCTRGARPSSSLLAPWPPLCCRLSPLHRKSRV